MKNAPIGKPRGGFWTSTYRGPLERSDWATFADQNLDPVRGEGVILEPGGKVYWMETQEDYDWLQSKFPRENQFGDPLIDWEALARSGRWDGVHVSRKGLRNLAQMGPGNYDPPLYGWDVESTIWFNPSALTVKGTTKLGSMAQRVAARYAALVDVGEAGKYWGRAGAGFLFTTGDRILLLKRAPWVYDPNVWGIPGGALMVDDETGRQVNPMHGALQEVMEEVGEVPAHRVIGKYVFRDGSFTYTTFIAETDYFTPRLDDESTDWIWATKEDLERLPLHYGVRALLRSKDPFTAPQTAKVANTSRFP